MLSPNNINQDPICWEKLEMLRLKLLFQVRLLPISTQLPHPPQNICIDESVSWDFRIGFGGEGFFFLFLHIKIVYMYENFCLFRRSKKKTQQTGKKRPQLCKVGNEQMQCRLLHMCTLQWRYAVSEKSGYRFLKEAAETRWRKQWKIIFSSRSCMCSR